MRKPVPSIIAALAVALVTVSTAAAITGGGVDGNAHPYVGALVVNGSVECSGVLVAPTVFVTAGHCGADGTRVSVSFDSKLTGGWSLLGGTLEVDPTKGADLAVVVLDAPAGVAPATLPAADSAGSLAQGRARDERRLRVLGLGGGWELPLRRPPSRGELARHEGLQVDALALDDPRRALPRRLRRPPAVGQHRALGHLVRAPRIAPARPRAIGSTRSSARAFLSAFVTLP